MILTVCPNTALDKILFVNKWTPGVPMRTNKTALSVGGKGLDSSVVLSHLDVETLALGFFSGNTGHELIGLLEDYGISIEPIWVGGNNRISYVIVDESTNIHNHVIVGDVEINEEQKNEFIEKFDLHLCDANWVILAGSVPPSLGDGFYYELIKRAGMKGVHTLIDSQKLCVTKAIEAKPDIVKMNREEFGETFSVQTPTFDSLYENAVQVRQKYAINNLVLTLSKDGILLLCKDGDFLGKAPVQKSVNAAGAGDAVSSTFAWRLSLGDNWAEALRWATAIGAASVLTPKTGDINIEDVNRIYREVEILPLS